MKKQKDITFEDIYPDIKGMHPGIIKQLKYVYKCQSRGMLCPACLEHHTENELILEKYICNGIELEVKVPMALAPYIMPTEEYLDILKERLKQ
jgi:hypothetical protein